MKKSKVRLSDIRDKPHERKTQQEHLKAKDIPNKVGSGIWIEDYKQKLISSLKGVPAVRRAAALVAILTFLSWGVNIKDNASIYKLDSKDKNLFEKILLPLDVRTAWSDRMTWAFDVPQEFSKGFDTWRSLDSLDDARLVEYVSGLIEKILLGVEVHGVFAEHYKEQPLVANSLKKVTLEATSSWEAKSDWLNSLIEPNQKNVDLAKIRFGNGSRIRWEAIQKLKEKYPDIQNLQVLGSTKEIEYSQEELDELYKLAIRLGYGKHGKMQSKSFDKENTDHLNLIFELIIDYDRNTPFDEKDKKELDDIIGKKRNLHYEVQYSKWRENVRTVPNPLLVRLLVSFLMVRGRDTVPLNLTFYENARNVADRLLQKSWNKPFKDLTLAEKKEFNTQLYFGLQKLANKWISTLEEVKYFIANPNKLNSFEKMYADAMSKPAFTNEIEHIVEDMLMKNALMNIKKLNPGITKDEISALASDRNLQKEFLEDILAKNKNDPAIKKEIEDIQKKYQGKYIFNLFLQEAIRWAEFLNKRP